MVCHGNIMMGFRIRIERYAYITLIREGHTLLTLAQHESGAVPRSGREQESAIEDSERRNHPLHSSRSRDWYPLHCCYCYCYCVMSFTGEVYPDFRFVRCICPWDLSLSTNVWEGALSWTWVLVVRSAELSQKLSGLHSLRRGC